MRFESPASQIANIKSRQDDLVVYQNEIRVLVKELGQWLDDAFRLNWNQTFPGVPVDFITGVDGGSMTNKWEPELYVYEIAGCHPTEAGEWVDKNNTKVKAPINLRELQEFFLLFLKMTQVPVKLAYGSPHKDFEVDEND